MIKKITLFGTYERVMKNDPEGSRKDHFKAFLTEVKASESLVEQLAEDYFERQHAAWKLRQVGDSVILGGTPATERRVDTAQRRRESEQRTAKAKDEIKERIRRVILLDLVLPTGKKLRESTGAECAKAGGFYAEIARHLKPSQVVDKHMNERDLQDMYSRFGGKKHNVEHRPNA